ncbi:MAG: hypothetical protein IKM43_03270 [Clostridia bacterium]|nr:hypothetical protein [Clostridia bacterium]
MSDKEKRFSFKWLEKLKKIKHIEVYVAILFIVILALIYLSNFKSDNASKTTKDTTTKELTITAYVDDLEHNLEEILTNIGGITNVKVMITLDMGQAQVSDSKINLNHFPNIKGVIVTANGVKDTSARMKVLHAIEAVIDVTNGNIEILSSD